jgi:hypothetical protein
MGGFHRLMQAHLTDRGLNHLHAETRRIEKTILTEFSKIDSADWK